MSARSVIASHRRDVEASIVKLASQRAAIDAELRILTTALGALEVAGKRKRTKKVDNRKAAVQVMLDRHRRVTVAQVAEQLGISVTYASGILAKIGRRVSRGVYARKK